MRRQYEDAAVSLASKYGIPPELFLKLIKQESGWNAGARSPAGAIGLAQLMPGTAKDLGVNPSDPLQNLEGGARYLSDQYAKFGDWDLALAAYNAGPGAVQKYGGVPPYAETQNYVKSIMGGGLDPGSLPAPSSPSGGGMEPSGGRMDMNALLALAQMQGMQQRPSERMGGHWMGLPTDLFSRV